MKVFGFTGGIGMGKSASGRLLEQRGMAVIDTDALARQIVEPGQAALAEIQQAFGLNTIGPDGRLRRHELAQRVFGDAAALKRLEGILHPRIHQLWKDHVNEWRSEGRPVGVVIIPLLFETGASPEFDTVVCVSCSAQSQMQRLRARSWDEAQIRNRIQAQWPIERKMEAAKYVVWTEGSMETHDQQLRRIIP